jgi:hypothetical protein
VQIRGDNHLSVSQGYDGDRATIGNPLPSAVCAGAGTAHGKTGQNIALSGGD